MNRPICHVYVRSAPGFSLVEIAVVIVIISFLVAMTAGPMLGRIEQSRRADTDKQLETIKEAIYGFAMANGRLPCPSISTSSGLESFCTTASGACTTTTTYQSHGRCATMGPTAPAGYVPSASLGIGGVDSSGFVTDAWADGRNARRIQYAVSRYTVSTTFPLTLVDGIKSTTMGTVAAGTNHLGVCSTGAGSVPTSTCAAGTTTLASAAPFVLLSLGKDSGTNSVDETNNQTNDLVFTQGTPNATFDDIITWGSLNTLFAKMVQAGKLP